MTRRMAVVLLAMLMACAAAPAARAEKIAKGSSVLWIGLNGNRSHIVSTPVSLNTLGEENEVGLHLAYSYFLSDDWAGVISGGFDAESQKFEPAAGLESKFKASSYNVRVGLDRYAFINDGVALYAGPGLLYWKGGSDYTVAGVTTGWPDVTEWAINGRIGMYARLASHVGLFGHIGHVVGTNTAEDAPGKVTWWSSHHEGSVGLALDF